MTKTLSDHIRAKSEPSTEDYIADLQNLSAAALHARTLAARLRDLGSRELKRKQPPGGWVHHAERVDVVAGHLEDLIGAPCHPASFFVDTTVEALLDTLDTARAFIRDLAFKRLCATYGRRLQLALARANRDIRRTAMDIHDHLHDLGLSEASPAPDCAAPG
jgi:hypothetical protein